MKRRVLIQSEKHIFQRIDFALISQFAWPMFFLLIAGISIVLSQWVILNKRGDSFKVGSPAPATYRVITKMRYDDRESAARLRFMVGESVAGVNVHDI